MGRAQAATLVQYIISLIPCVERSTAPQSVPHYHPCSAFKKSETAIWLFLKEIWPLAFSLLAANKRNEKVVALQLMTTAKKNQIFDHFTADSANRTELASCISPGRQCKRDLVSSWGFWLNESCFLFPFWTEMKTWMITSHCAEVQPVLSLTVCSFLPWGISIAIQTQVQPVPSQVLAVMLSSSSSHSMCISNLRVLYHHEVSSVIRALQS